MEQPYYASVDFDKDYLRECDLIKKFTGLDQYSIGSNDLLDAILEIESSGEFCFTRTKWNCSIDYCDLSRRGECALSFGITQWFTAEENCIHFVLVQFVEWYFKATRS